MKDAAFDAGFLDAALRVARMAAEAAAIEIRRYYRRDAGVRIKADQTPVTAADEAAETAIRAVLRQHFPDHASYGEEFGRDGDSPFLWLIDPIDGTRSFVRNYPMFSTQIALMHEDELLLGVSLASEFGETCWARRGGGAFCNGERIRVSGCENIEKAALSFGNLKRLARGPGWQMLAGLVSEAERVRGYGDFYQYHLLARSALDTVIESDVNILDIAALAVIVREAGGVFTDLSGRAPTLETTSVLAATPKLHAALLPRFSDFGAT